MLASLLTPDNLQLLAPYPAVFERGQALAQTVDDVANLSAAEIRGRVNGSNGAAYGVWVRAEHGELLADCSCPFERSPWCKHAIAVGLAWHRLFALAPRPALFPSSVNADPLDPLTAHDPQTTVSILADAAANDPTFAQALHEALLTSPRRHLAALRGPGAEAAMAALAELPSTAQTVAVLADAIADALVAARAGQPHHLGELMCMHRRAAHAAEDLDRAGLTEFVVALALAPQAPEPDAVLCGYERLTATHLTDAASALAAAVMSGGMEDFVPELHMPRLLDILIVAFGADGALAWLRGAALTGMPVHPRWEDRLLAAAGAYAELAPRLRQRLAEEPSASAYEQLRDVSILAGVWDDAARADALALLAPDGSGDEGRATRLILVREHLSNGDLDTALALASRRNAPYEGVLSTAEALLAAGRTEEAEALWVPMFNRCRHSQRASAHADRIADRMRAAYAEVGREAEFGALCEPNASVDAWAA